MFAAANHVVQDAALGFNWTLFVRVQHLLPLEVRRLVVSHMAGRVPVSWETVNATGIVTLSVSSGASASVLPTNGSLAAVGDTPVSSSLRYYEPDVAGPQSKGFTAANPWCVVGWSPALYQSLVLVSEAT